MARRKPPHKRDPLTRKHTCPHVDIKAPTEQVLHIERQLREFAYTKRDFVDLLLKALTLDYQDELDAIQDMALATYTYDRQLQVARDAGIWQGDFRHRCRSRKYGLPADPTKRRGTYTFGEFRQDWTWGYNYVKHFKHLGGGWRRTEKFRRSRRCWNMPGNQRRGFERETWVDRFWTPTSTWREPPMWQGESYPQRYTLKVGESTDHKVADIRYDATPRRKLLGVCDGGMRNFHVYLGKERVAQLQERVWKTAHDPLARFLSYVWMWAHAPNHEILPVVHMKLEAYKYGMYWLDLPRPKSRLVRLY